MTGLTVIVVEACGGIVIAASDPTGDEGRANER